MEAKQGEHPLGDRGQLVLFLIFMLVWIADSFIFNWSTVFTPLVPVLLRWTLAIVLFILAFMLVQSGHRVIPHHQPVEKLVKEGAFRFIRHPLYLGTILFYAALVFATLSLLAVAVFIALLVFYNYIAGYEEKLLEMKFSEEYSQYRRETPRWIPRLFNIS
jgi:protein-S-isoprenylcysteine O-methyltransferase Ste14